MLNRHFSIYPGAHILPVATGFAAISAAAMPALRPGTGGIGFGTLAIRFLHARSFGEDALGGAH